MINNAETRVSLDICMFEKPNGNTEPRVSVDIWNLPSHIWI